jgi:hypothetical protein
VRDARGYWSATHERELRQLGFSVDQAIAPALVIPIYGTGGEIVTYQARPDRPRVRNGRPVKYETPSRSRMHLDVPPSARGAIGNPAATLMITEGVRKGDAGATQGMCCIALLGVWNWRGTNELGGKVALPEWELIALNDREVYLVFDSDVLVKREVRAALDRLAEFLRHRGARVEALQLPTGENDAKTGLDDYFAAGHTVANLLALPRFGAGVDAPPPEAGQRLLDDVAGYLSRFVAFASPAQRDAAALWTAHTHGIDAFETTPRLAITSPEKQSGKTRLLEVLETLVAAPLATMNISVAALFRAVDQHRPTLLFDEADAVFGPRATGDHEDLRALLNSGHRRGASVFRCVGKKHDELGKFAVFCAVALAGIGDLPDTIRDRSIVVRLRRRAPDEHVDEFRPRRVQAQAEDLRERLAVWAQAMEPAVRESDPSMPEGITDRAADVWQSLLTIADLAGADWPDRARRAAVELNRARIDGDGSLGTRLLGDVRTVFGERGADVLLTAELLESLHAIIEAPWGDIRGRPLDDRGLARRLRPFGVHPHNVRPKAGLQGKGYARADFADTWKRYLRLVTVPVVPGAASVPGNRLSDRERDAGTPGTDTRENSASGTLPLGLVHAYCPNCGARTVVTGDAPVDVPCARCTPHSKSWRSAGSLNDWVVS